VDDGLLDLAAVRREFRGWGAANLPYNARGAACAWLAHLDFDETKRGGFFDLPFPDAKRTGELANGQRTGFHTENALDAVETFAAESERAHGGRWESAARSASEG
jgi:hypothetical protein